MSKTIAGLQGYIKVWTTFTAGGPVFGAAVTTATAFRCKITDHELSTQIRDTGVW